MVDFHFHDSEFTLFGKTVEIESEDETDPTGTAPPEDPGGRSGAVGALIALVVLVMIAFAVRRALGDDEGEELPETDVDSVV